MMAYFPVNKCNPTFQEDIALVTLLKLSAAEKDLHTGSKLHADILKAGLLQTNIYVGNALVNVYVKCAALANAHQVFEDLPVRDVVSWTALVTGYAQHGHGMKVFQFCERMHCEALCPDALTFACILKACGITEAVHKGKRVHAQMASMGLLGENSVLGTALVDMYAKCGALVEARHVLNELWDPNLVCWTAMIAGYAQHQHGKEALYCFERMQGDGISPNALTFAFVLKACGCIGAAMKGKEIHAEVVRKELLGVHSVLDTALVDMYVKCGALVDARHLLAELPVQSVTTWTALIAGYVENKQDQEALNLFKRMQDEGPSPNGVTFVCILKVCRNSGAAEKGKEIHVEIVRQGWLGKGNSVSIALVAMYAECRALNMAQEVFDELSAPDVVAWNALITGYCQHGYGEDALRTFEGMKDQGVSPNMATFSGILKACGIMGEAGKGQETHNEILRQGLLAKATGLGTALVDMYAKCGSLTKAEEVLDELPVRDAVSWNALIAGYARQGLGEEALSCLERMQGDGVSPNEVTFLSVVKACGSIGAADKGEQVHSTIIREGVLVDFLELERALLDMYGKCGDLRKAQWMFEKLPVRDVISWTTLMAGYSGSGKHEIVFDLYNKMVEEGIEPNMVTFVVLLSACTSIGSVDKGQQYFESMRICYGIIPTLEHHTCMVDLYGRAGYFDKAMAVLWKMEDCDYLPLWFSLLGACQKWGNNELGRVAFKNVARVDEESTAASHV